MMVSSGVEPDGIRLNVHRKAAEDDCVKVSTIHALGRNLGESGIDVVAPARSMFTITTVCG